LLSKMAWGWIGDMFQIVVAVVSRLLILRIITDKCCLSDINYSCDGVVVSVRMLQGSLGFVKEKDRKGIRNIKTFDFNGTLWIYQDIYEVGFLFLLGIKALMAVYILNVVSVKHSIKQWVQQVCPSHSYSRDCLGLYLPWFRYWIDKMMPLSQVYKVIFGCCELPN